MGRLKLTTKHRIRKQVKHMAVTDPTYNWEKMSGQEQGTLKLEYVKNFTGSLQTHHWNN